MSYKIERVPIRGTKIYYTGYDGTNVCQSFRCEKCSCTKYYRHKLDYKSGFFEGSFICMNCKNESNYYSDSFIRTENSEVTQLSLFD